MRFNRMMSWLVVAMVLVLSAPLRANLQAELSELVRRAGTAAGSVGVCVIDVASGRELASINSQRPLIPASNMKVVTTAAALSMLGPDFAFRTELRLVAGDAQAAVLLVRGDGDPGFGDPKLLARAGYDVERLLGLWVKAVTDTGIRRVTRLVIDERVFDTQRVHPTWPVDQLNRWYCAQVSGLNFHDNCLDVYATPTAGGGRPVIRLSPAAPFLPVSNRAASGGKGALLVNRSDEHNALAISGFVPSSSIDPLNVPIHDPAVFFARVLADRLQRAGVAVESIDRAGAAETFAAGRLLHAIQTTLPAVLQRCNKDSQNLFAEALNKRLGHAVTGQPGSWASGSAALSAFVNKTLGPAGAGLEAADGSGMSRDNRVTARILAGLLAAMQRDPRLGPVYLNSLSVAGQDGTLESRLHEGFTGQVYGKTGYIAGVSTLSGLIVSPGPAGGAPRAAAFSLLFNNVRDLRAVRRLQEQMVRAIDDELR